MMRLRPTLALGTFATAAAAIASAQPVSTEAPIRLNPSEIAALPTYNPGAGTSGLKAIRMTLLHGDPRATGPYTIALHVPPNTKIASHTHRDARTAVVVQGAWTFGYGSTASAPDVLTLGPGSFYSEPAGLPHFARTGTEGATVYISGFGPSDTVYVE
jgi:uncharacterized RmlC-like cupin family protein